MDQKESFCQIDKHDQRVCLFKDCNKPRQYCQYCQHDHHQDHFNEIKPFKYLEEIIKEKRGIYQIIQQQIQEMRKVVGYFQKFIASINFDNIHLKSLNPQQYNTLVENLFYIDSIQENLLEKVIDNVVDLQNSADIFKEIINKSLQNRKEEQNWLSQQLEIQQVEPFKNKIGFYFQELNYDGLTYKEDCKLLKISNSRSLVCLEPQIKVNSIKKVSFLFQSFEESYLGLLTHRNSSLHNNKIGFDKKFAVSQWAYLIDHKGHLITPNEPKLLNILLPTSSFTFSQQQIINLEADLQAGYLTFFNYHTKRSKKIGIDKSQDILFCAGGLNCEVRIVNLP